MHQRTSILTALMILAVGCTEQSPVTAPDVVDESMLRASVQWSPDRYPTEAEFAASGVAPSLFVTKPIANFGHSTFNASAVVAYEWANVANGSLSARLADRSGTTINQATDARSMSVFVPVVGGWSLFASASTMGRSCGLIGKSSAGGRAELHLLRLSVGSWQPFMFWHNEITQDGNDAWQGTCEYLEEATQVWESGEGCGDAEYCGVNGADSGYPPSPGGGGSGDWCVLWEFVVYESGDGGYTWHEVHRYYAWQC
jgi:hypothetical protein